MKPPPPATSSSSEPASRLLSAAILDPSPMSRSSPQGGAGQAARTIVAGRARGNGDRLRVRVSVEREGGRADEGTDICAGRRAAGNAHRSRRARDRNEIRPRPYRGSAGAGPPASAGRPPSAQRAEGGRPALAG